MLIKNINKILVVLMCLVLTSCGTLFRGTTQPVTFTSTPSEADIFIDEYYCGKTPQTFLLKRKYPHQIWLVQEGREPQYYTLDPQLNFIVVGNALYIPIGAGVGAGVGAIIAAICSGDSLIGIVIPAFGIVGAGVGVVAALVGTGIDMASGGAYAFSTDSIQAEFAP